ncbi:MAG: hypothetical protein WA908_12005 [Pontixanthobacter sp.]
MNIRISVILLAAVLFVVSQLFGEDSTIASVASSDRAVLKEKIANMEIGSDDGAVGQRDGARPFASRTGTQPADDFDSIEIDDYEPSETFDDQLDGLELSGNGAQTARSGNIPNSNASILDTGDDTRRTLSGSLDTRAKPGY